MNIKIVPIIVGMLLCSSLHLHAGLFDSVSDLTGGLIKIEQKKDTADHGEDAEGEVLSKRARKYSKKMSHDEYIAERDAFISLVTEKYGVYASEFNLNNDDFAIIREMLPEDANGLSEKIGVLRGAVQSQLKYASHRKDGIKLLNKLSADEAEIDATFNSLKARAKQKQEELAAAQKAEREAREKAEREARELAATQKAEREAREKAERETRELVSSQEIIPHAKEVAGEVSAKETSENDIAAGNAVSAVSSSATGPVESESSTVQVECKLVLISLGVWFATVVVMGLIVFLSRKPSPDNIPKNVRACYFINRWDYAPTFLSIAVVLALPFCFARARLGEPWANALLVTCSLTVLAVNWLALFKANTSWGLATMMMPFRVIMGALGPLLPLASVVMTFAGISAVNEGRKSLGAAKERIRANHGWASERDVRDINSGKSSISSGIATAIVGAIFGWISKKLWESINTRTRSLVGWESWD